MEKTRFLKFANKEIKNSKSVSERLVNIRLQKPSNTCSSKNYNENSVTEYPKLRRPKPETLLKIQALQKKSDRNSMVIERTEDVKNQEFIVKKEQLEHQGNIILNENFRAVFDDAKPNTFDSKLYLPDLLKNNQTVKLDKNSNEKFTKPLNSYEQQLVNIFRTKVTAHPNGLFAENLPVWYKKTFKKDVPFNWLELLRSSDQFDIENVNNKIVLYTKDTNELQASDSNGSDKFGTRGSKDSVGFVRYKHLQKSLKEYSKQAGRNYPNVSKRQ